MSLDTAIIQQYYAGILRLTPSAATINAYAQLPSYEAAMDAMMNAAVSSVNPITKLYQAAFDRVPDSTGLTNYTAAYGAGAGTMTLKQIANQWTSTVEFTTDYPATMPNADYVGLLYWNVLHRAADPVGAANFTAALNSGKMTRADVLLELSQSPEFAFRIDDHIRGFQEQCALKDPAAYTGTLWDKVPPGPGDVITLTTGIDTVDLTASGKVDVVRGVESSSVAGDDNGTFNTGDVILGNGLTILDLTLNEFAAGDVDALATVTDVAVANMKLGKTSDLNMLDWDRVDAVNVEGGNTGLTLNVNNAKLATEYVMTGRQYTTTVANWSGATGSADTAQIAAIGTGTSTADSVFNIAGGNAIEAVALRTTGANFIEVNGGTGVKTITITGDGVNDTYFESRSATSLTIDASATTGKNTFAFDAADPVLNTTATIKGGSATNDVLSLVNTSGAAATVATPTVSGVETLAVNLADNTTINVSRAGSITAINATTAAGNDANTLTVNAAKYITDINVVAVASRAAGDNDSNAITFTGASFTGAANAVNLNVDTTADLVDTVGLVTSVSGLETLNINVTGDADDNSATFDGFTATAGTTAINVATSGFTTADDQLVDLGTIQATDSGLETFDASGAQTGVTVYFDDTSFADDATVTGGTGDDILDTQDVDLSAGTADLNVVGGEGADLMFSMAAGDGTGDVIFTIAQGDTGITVGTLDQIVSFNTGDDALALGEAGDGANYSEAAVAQATFSAALTAANAQFVILESTAGFASSQAYALVDDLGTDSWLFIDYTLDGKADAAIQLIGTQAAAFAASDIIV